MKIFLAILAILVCAAIVLVIMCCMRMSGLYNNLPLELKIADEITLADCLGMFEEHGYRTIINDGKIIDFIEEE